MNNDKKMPQGNPNQNQPKQDKQDFDQKKPQSDRSGIGQEQGNQPKEKQPGMKPDADVENPTGKKPQSNPGQELDLDDDDDNQVTQRSNRQANDPSRGK